MNLLIPPFLGSQLYKEVSDHSCQALDRQTLQQYPWVQSLDSLLPLQRVDWQLRGGSRAVPSPWIRLSEAAPGIHLFLPLPEWFCRTYLMEFVVFNMKYLKGKR